MLYRPVNGTNFGQVDIDELAAIVRQMQTRGWAQPGQVGIVGCSYGGYFVTQSLVRHPGLYGAGHTRCSLVDSVTEWNWGYDSLMLWLQGLPPFANLDEYRKDSPLYNAGKVREVLLDPRRRRSYDPALRRGGTAAPSDGPRWHRCQRDSNDHSGPRAMGATYERSFHRPNGRPYTLVISIPPGVASGTKLRVPEAGGRGVSGGRDGDFVLTARVG